MAKIFNSITVEQKRVIIQFAFCFFLGGLIVGAILAHQDVTSKKENIKKEIKNE